MQMLLEHMLACALIGLITSGILTFIVDDRKSNVVMFFMLLFGATFGWLIGMVFIFVTGGLELSIPWLALPVVTTLFASMIMLYKFRNIGIVFLYRPRWQVSRISAILSVLVLFALVGSLVVLALPQGYSSSYNTQVFSVRDADYEGSEITLSSSQARQLSRVTPTGLVPISFDTAKSSVSFPRIAVNPEQGDYLEFLLTFNVGSGVSWDQPYIGICVFEDPNGNGEPDAGEGIWNDLFYMGPTDPSYKYWRSNCVFDTSGNPVAEFFVASVGGDLLLLPIFQADVITNWKTDSSHTFPNTPQQYTPPNDMISWEVTSSGGLTLKEQVTSFASISAGENIKFKGKIYCPEGSAGSHGLLVRAFDARFTNPYTPNEDPLAEHVMSFIIETGNGPVCGNGICETGETYENCPEDCDEDGPICGNGICEEGETVQNCPEDCSAEYPGIDIESTSWVTIAIFGLGTIGGAGVLITKGPKWLKP